MKIIIAGKGNTPIFAINYLRQKHKGVKCLALPGQGHKSEQFPNFKNFCAKLNIPITTLAEAQAMKNSIFFSLEYEKIIDPSKFKSHRLLNIHFSKLPKYRGVYTSIWPILNAETESGCSLHYIDKGIDSGPIVARKTFGIDNVFSSERLYEKYLETAKELFKEQIDCIVDGRIIAVPQDEAQSTYYSRQSINLKNIEISFNDPAELVARRIRALTFRMFQLPRHGADPIFGCRITNDVSKKKPGTVVKVLGASKVVSTIDYDIEIHIDRFDALMQSIQSSNAKQLEPIVLLQREYLNERNQYGRTPLIEAVKCVQPRIVEKLLQLGADPNRPDWAGNTPLDYLGEGIGVLAFDELKEIMVAHGARAQGENNLKGFQ